jgi:hypothetical protein
VVGRQAMIDGVGTFLAVHFHVSMETGKGENIVLTWKVFQSKLGVSLV